MAVPEGRSVRLEEEPRETLETGMVPPGIGSARLEERRLERPEPSQRVPEAQEERPKVVPPVDARPEGVEERAVPGRPERPDVVRGRAAEDPEEGLDLRKERLRAPEGQESRGERHHLPVRRVGVPVRAPGGVALEPVVPGELGAPPERLPDRPLQLRLGRPAPGSALSFRGR